MWQRNTRTRSASTNPQPDAASKLVLRTGRFLAVGAALLLVVAGCASGDKDESRRYNEREAESTEIVSRLQETQVAEAIRVPTATPVPTMTPAASLSRLVLTNDGGGGVPSSEVRSASVAGGTVYAAALISNVQSGQLVTAVWVDGNGDVIAQSEQSAGGSDQQWLYFPLQLNGSLPRGEYGVVITVDGTRLESLAFRLT